MSTKSKSASSEIPNAKVSPATARVNKSTRGVSKSDPDSPTPLQNSRLSVDRSPRSLPSKPMAGRSPKLTTPAEKKPLSAHILKPSGSELQAEINQAHEDLKKANEKLVSVEKEKEKALAGLKEAQRLAEEAKEKLKEALMAQKRAEENSEIEKFRAVEMEQATIEAAQKKEEEWQKELETVRSQHAEDVAALLNATQQIQRATQEMAMIRDAKDQALRHAEDATKIAENHVEKIELLSTELAQLKYSVDSRAKTEASEHNKLISKLHSEIESLKHDLEKKESLEETIAENEAAMEQLHVNLEAAHMAESYARRIAEELQERVEDLSSQAEQAKSLERSTSQSLECVLKQLKESNDLLHEAEMEIAALKEKIVLLEISFERQKKDLEEAECRFEEARSKASYAGEEVVSLRSLLETVKEEKTQSLNNEKLAAASVTTLLEEKDKLINELEISRDEGEKSKKALESLTSALHDVSSEARDAKEKLRSIQVEHEHYESQIEDLKLVLKTTDKKYESMLEEARQEIKDLTSSIQQSRLDHESSRTEWEQREFHLTNAIKESEEEISSMGNEIKGLISSLKAAEEQVRVTREECDNWKNSLKEAESEALYLKEVMGVAKAESENLKECLMDRENELQNLLHENEELRKREVASSEKVEELSKQLEEARLSNNNNNNTTTTTTNDNNKQEEENCELSDSEKDYDMLPNIVEFSEQNGTRGDTMKPKAAGEGEKKLLADDEKSVHKVENLNGKVTNEKEAGKFDSSEVDIKMWDSCKIEEKDFSPEPESFEEGELELKGDGAESIDRVNNGANEMADNGGNSPSEQQQNSQKKKKALLRKFGNLLKKKSPISQK